MRILQSLSLIILALAAFGCALITDQGASGPVLYQRYCAECHFPLSITRKPNRSYRAIATAIRTVRPMAGLVVLSRQEIETIAEALQQ